ncbi:GNAT family N-acetyltransferase [Paenibacillus frigoriresistens]|nr:GNAT family N-acetyltransferase [Paenibacillus frigoriresistens]
MIEIRDFKHISLFFVDGKNQKRGIAKSLLAMAIDKIKKQNSMINSISVNSSPYGVSAYEKMGFQKSDDEQVIKGMRFTPMIKLLFS